MANVLEIKSLKKHFGAVKVIEDLTFSVSEGSVFGFVGINGAGKTTTMKIVLGLLESDGGEILVCGEKAAYGRTAKGVGYLPDVPEFYSYMKPMEYLNLCGEISGMSKSAIKEKGEELLNLVGLSKNKRKIGGFSRGMKQRLGIAQALLNSPKLLICDEPTSALDPMGRKEILDILASLKGKTTVIFSTHILSDVERICDGVAFIHNGKTALTGEISSVKKRRSDSYKIEFATENEAEKFASALKIESASKEANETLIKTTDGGKLIKTLAENNLTPLKFELLEPTLEDLFLEVIK